MRSYLHIGLGRGDTRPSGGRAWARESEVRARLVAAAREAGNLTDEEAAAAVRGTLGVLAARLPAGERGHLLSHLPTDVRKLAALPQQLRREAEALRTVSGFVAAVGKASGLVAPEDDEETAVRGALRTKIAVHAVLGELRGLVPEEGGDVAAVLPGELRAFWEKSSPGPQPLPT